MNTPQKILAALSLLAFAGAVALFAANEPPPFPKVMEVFWDYPADKLSTNLEFRVRSSTVLRPSAKDYTNIVATFAVTNLTQTDYAWRFPNQMGGEYFVIEAWNRIYERGSFSPVVRDEPALATFGGTGIREVKP